MPLAIIRASAGSGKTYQLALAFIRLLARGAEGGHAQNPGAILATTFTRAAAGEILERVVSRLAAAALREASRLELAEKMGVPLSAAGCSQLLGSLAMCMDRLAVSTMDAFFAQIAKAFAGELGLAPDWTMAVDDGAEELLRETLHSILDETAPESLTAALWTVRQGHVGSMLDGLANLVPGLDTAPVTSEPPGDFAQPSVRRWDAPELARIAELLAAREEWMPRTQRGKVNAHWERAVGALATVLVPGVEAAKLLELTLPRHIFRGDDYSRAPVPAVLRDAMRPLLECACGALREEHANRERALGWLAALYSMHRMRTAFRMRRYGFSDLARMVTAAALERDELYFRLGTRFEHVLFDEFQDTSALQFQFFRPVIEEIGGAHGEVLVVGDEKQAIYGWRGGERALMHGPLDALASRIGRGEGKVLSESFRSGPAVLDSVNRTFLALRGAWCGGDDEADRLLVEAGLEWATGFETHRAAESVRELGGCVRIVEVPAETGPGAEDADAPLIQAAIGIVGRHLAADPGCRIGVLLRKRRLMPRLIAELRRRCDGIEVSGEGGNPLTDSRAVEVILELLAWLDHPGLTAARHLVLASPLSPAFGFPSGTDVPEKACPAEHGVVDALRAALASRGFTPVLREWLGHAAFSSHCNDHDAQRCEQLIEMAREADARGVARLSDFVAHVRTRRVERPGGAGVRVMTVHASKGLEFDAVVLMEIDARQGGGGLGIFADVDGTLRIAPSKETAPFLGMEEVSERRRREEFMEELSVLYVGMTRARALLDIVLREGSSAPVARLLRHALPADAEGVVVSSKGLSLCEWARRKAGDAAKVEWVDTGFATDEAGVTLPGLFAGRPAYVTPSGADETRIVTAESILLPGNRSALRRGELFHIWLGGIEWLDDGVPDEDALMKRAADVPHGFPRVEVAALARELLAILDSSESDLHRALTRPGLTGAAGMEVWRERRFAVWIEDGGHPEVLTGAFDRVVLWLDETGRALRAEILDFKSDSVSSPEARAQAMERYAPQLEAYRRAMRRLRPELRVEDISARLVFIESGSTGAAS